MKATPMSLGPIIWFDCKSFKLVVVMALIGRKIKGRGRE
jgi:hypothetical protein